LLIQGLAAGASFFLNFKNLPAIFLIFLFQLFEVVDFILNFVIFPEMVDGVKNLIFPGLSAMS
jgi:hypothetical protein